MLLLAGGKVFKVMPTYAARGSTQARRLKAPSCCIDFSEPLRATFSPHIGDRPTSGRPFGASDEWRERSGPVCDARWDRGDRGRDLGRVITEDSEYPTTSVGLMVSKLLRLKYDDRLSQIIP